MARKLEILIVAKDEASGIFKDIQGTLGSFGTIAAGVVAAGAAAAAAAVAGLGLIIKDSIGDAMEAQEALAQFDNALKVTGSSVPRGKLLGLAEALQDVTRFSDETVMSVETMLLRFGIGEDAIFDTTKLALDMATALGTDATEAARLLGKTLEQPAEGLSALTRLGVRFTDEQKKLVEAMVEGGDVAGAQAFILEQLQGRFEGAAEAAGTTLAGQMDIFSNQLSDIKEEIGGAFMPVLSQAMQTIGPLIKEGAQALADFFASPQVQAGMQQIVSWIQEAIPQVREFIGNLIDELLPVIRDVFAEEGPAILANFKDLWADLSAFWEEHGDKIMEVVKVVFGIVVATISGAITLISGIIAVLGNLLRGDFRGMWEAAKQTILGFISGALAVVGQKLSDFVGTWRGIWNNMKTIAIAIWDGIKSGVESKVKGWVDALIAALKAAIDKVKRALGIKSPSGVFREIGEQMMQGLALGVAGGSALPELAIGRAAAGAGGALTKNFMPGWNVSIRTGMDERALLERMNTLIRRS